MQTLGSDNVDSHKRKEHKRSLCGVGGGQRVNGTEGCESVWGVRGAKCAGQERVSELTKKKSTSGKNRKRNTLMTVNCGMKQQCSKCGHSGD